MFSWSLRSALFHLGGRTAEARPTLRLSRTSQRWNKKTPWPPPHPPSPRLPAAPAARPGKAVLGPGGGLRGRRLSPAQRPAPSPAPSRAASAGAGHGAGPAQTGRGSPGDVPGETLSGAPRTEGGKPGPFYPGKGWKLLGNGQRHFPQPFPCSQHQGEIKISRPALL